MLLTQMTIATTARLQESPAVSISTEASTGPIRKPVSSSIESKTWSIFTSSSSCAVRRHEVRTAGSRADTPASSAAAPIATALTAGSRVSAVTPPSAAM